MNSSDNQDDSGIYAYLHCSRCLQELPDDQSPAQYARLAVGVGANGDLVVWCNRHDIKVTRIANEEVGHQLMLVSGSPCECGNHNNERETLH